MEAIFVTHNAWLRHNLVVVVANSSVDAHLERLDQLDTRGLEAEACVIGGGDAVLTKEVLDCRFRGMTTFVP